MEVSVSGQTMDVVPVRDARSDGTDTDREEGRPMRSTSAGSDSGTAAPDTARPKGARP